MVFFLIWVSSILTTEVVIFTDDPKLSFFYYFLFPMMVLILSIWYSSENIVSTRNYKKIYISRQKYMYFGILLTLSIITMAYMFWLGFFKADFLFLTKTYISENVKNPLLKVSLIIVNPLYIAESIRLILLNKNLFNKIIGRAKAKRIEVFKFVVKQRIFAF